MNAVTVFIIYQGNVFGTLMSPVFPVKIALMSQRKTKSLFPFSFCRWGRLVCGLMLFCGFCFPFRSSGAQPGADEPVDWTLEATNHLGNWIWETNATDKQAVRLWRAFAISGGAEISSAILRITVDNGDAL